MSHFLGLSHMFQEKVTSISCVCVKGLKITHYILGMGKQFLYSTVFDIYQNWILENNVFLVFFFFPKNDINLLTSPNFWLVVEDRQELGRDEET